MTIGGEIKTVGEAILPRFAEVAQGKLSLEPGEN